MAAARIGGGQALGVTGPGFVLVGPEDARSSRIALSPPGYFTHID